MRIVYASRKIEQQCTDEKVAKKLFGGNEILVRSLFARLNAIEYAIYIKDIIKLPAMRFHKLEADLKGLFAVDVKSRRDAWRIILQPLDNNEEPFIPCNIDEIAMIVRIVKIMEVSKHYE